MCITWLCVFNTEHVSRNLVIVEHHKYYAKFDDVGKSEVCLVKEHDMMSLHTHTHTHTYTHTHTHTHTHTQQSYERSSTHFTNYWK